MSQELTELEFLQQNLQQKTSYTEGYHYYIYDTEYHAGRREQANLMYDVFQALSEKYPQKVADMALVCTSVSKKSDVLSPGTHHSNPSYFRMCREYTILGTEYLVGASYGLDAKIAEIYRMIECCGEDREIFRLDGYEPKSKKSDIVDEKEKSEAFDTADMAEKNEEIQEKTSVDAFVYELWGERHMADKLSTLMHDVFDFIADKYADKIPDIAKDDSITFVAYKREVDNQEISMSKRSYFRAKKEHDVHGELYYVSTSYNRQQGIGQLKKMLEKCEGDDTSLKIISCPQKVVYGRRKRKAGLEELLG